MHSPPRQQLADGVAHLGVAVAFKRKERERLGAIIEFAKASHDRQAQIGVRFLEQVRDLRGSLAGTQLAQGFHANSPQRGHTPHEVYKVGNCTNVAQFSNRLHRLLAYPPVRVVCGRAYKRPQRARILDATQGTDGVAAHDVRRVCEILDQVTRKLKGGHFYKGIHDALADPPVFVAHVPQQARSKFSCGIADLARDLHSHAAHVDVAASHEPHHRARQVHFLAAGKAGEGVCGPGSYYDLPVLQSLDKRGDDVIRGDGFERVDGSEPYYIRAFAHALGNELDRALGAETLQAIEGCFGDEGVARVEFFADAIEELLLGGDSGEGDDDLHEDALVGFGQGASDHGSGFVGSFEGDAIGGEVLDCSGAFTGIAMLEHGLQEGQGMMAGARNEGVHGFFAAMKLGAGGEGREDFERSFSTDLLEEFVAGGADVRVWRGEDPAEINVCGDAIDLGDDLHEHVAQNLIGLVQRANEGKEQVFAGGAFDESAEDSAAKAMLGRFGAGAAVEEQAEDFQNLAGRLLAKLVEEVGDVVLARPRRRPERLVNVRAPVHGIR